METYNKLKGLIICAGLLCVVHTLYSQVPISTNYDPKISEFFDWRQSIATLSDSTTLEYVPNGFLTYVEDLGLYYIYRNGWDLYIPQANNEIPDAFNGTAYGSPKITVVSNGTTVKLAIEKNGGGDIKMLFSDGEYDYDTTPADSVTLTVGTDSAPQLNYIYFLQSNKTLTASTTGFPATEHAPIAEVLVQSAPSVQGDGPYKVHAYTDHLANSANQGHISHLNYWVRQQSATYVSGVDQTLTITTAPSPDDVIFTTSVGEVLQLHDHSFPAFQGTPKLYIVNDPTTAYDTTRNLNTLLTDSEGNSMSGNYFSLVIWGVVNEDDAECKLMLNLPSGSYNTEAEILDDAEGYANYSIPSVFTGTGFLISELKLSHATGGGGQWSVVEEIDLRGLEPSLTAGGGAGGSGHNIYNFSGTLTGDRTVYSGGYLLTFDSATVDITHTAVQSDEHALEIDVKANGIGDVKALDIFYETGAILQGEDEAVILVDIDESKATGGDVVGLEVLSTEGSSKIIGMEVGVNVNPIFQLSGTFLNPDSAYLNGVSVLTEFTTADSGGVNNIEIFTNDNDSIILGNANKFEEIEFLLEITASQNIQPLFYFSTGVGTWTQFTPVDGTNGMLNNGVVAWLESDIPTWAVGQNSQYLIKVVRTRNGLSIAPKEDKILIAEANLYTWDKEGDITARKITVDSLFGDGSNITNPPNIYTADGSLSGNRTVTLGGNSLQFNNSPNSLTFETDGGMVFGSESSTSQDWEFVQAADQAYFRITGDNAANLRLRDDATGANIKTATLMSSGGFFKLISELDAGGTSVDNMIVGDLSNGKIGVGLTDIVAHLDVYDTKDNDIALLIRGGEGGTSYDGMQIAFGYDGTDDYMQGIRTRHNSIGDTNNAIDFYVWDHGIDGQSDMPTNHIMTMAGDNGGSVGIGVTSPEANLHIFDGEGGTPQANDKFVVESNNIDGTKARILGLDAGYQEIALGSPTNSRGAYMNWIHGGLDFSIGTDQSGGEINFLTGDEVQAMTIDSAQRVGIGTTSPSETLNVLGDIALGDGTPRTDTLIFRNNRSGDANALGVISFRNNDAQDYEAAAIKSYNRGSANDGSLEFWTTNAAVSSEVMRLTPSKKMGINTDIPSATLDVSGSIRAQLNAQPTIGVGLELRYSEPNAKIVSYDRDAAQYKYIDYNALEHHFENKGTTNMVIDSTGNVGIGTTSPASKLDVNGPVRIGNSGVANDYEGLRIIHTSTSGGGIITQTVGNDPFLTVSGWDSGSERIIYLGGGNWGFDDANSIRFFTDSGYAGSSNEGVERMRIDSDGNVGIGTTSPNYTLEVNGANLGWVNGDHDMSFNTPATETGLIFNLNQLGNRSRFNISNMANATAANRYMDFRYNDDAAGSALTVRYGGNVGIGISDPNAKFHIGNNVATGALDNFSEYQILLYDSGAASTSYGLGIRGSTMVFNSDVEFDFDIDATTTGASIRADKTILRNYDFDTDQSVGASQDNYVLTYDNADGQISLEPASGGGGAPQSGTRVKLAETEVTSPAATVDFTGLDTTYFEYYVEMLDIVPVNDAVDFYMRVGTGATPTYQTTGYTFHVHRTFNPTTHYSATPTSFMAIARDVGSSTNEKVTIRQSIYDIPGDWFYTSGAGSSHSFQGYGNNTYVGTTWENTTDVTAIRYYFESGNIESGKFILYGIVK